ncbi:MAG: DUF5662 family protein [Baekduia sp.]
MSYDSRPDTWEHIDEVRRRLRQITIDLERRADDHDKSKLTSPEVEIFDEFTPKLKATTYDSPEYREFLVGMGEGLQHHYAVNDHHPEHFLNGIGDMDLLQVIEMLCDWKAATMRHDDGDLFNSIQANAGRFGYGDEMRHLLLNTARNLGWI